MARSFYDGLREPRVTRPITGGSRSAQDVDFVYEFPFALGFGRISGPSSFEVRESS